MFEFTLRIDPSVAKLLGLEEDSIIESFYDPEEGEIVIRVLDEKEDRGDNAPDDGEYIYFINRCPTCPMFCPERGICTAKMNQE